jgi:hypothetical protein
MDYELRRIKGVALHYPQHADESWPNDRGPTGEAQWKETVARFAALLDELATVAESASKLWEDQVPATHATHSQQASSVLAVLWQTVVHNSYHTGQIALLRRHFGAWPPTGGGTHGRDHANQFYRCSVVLRWPLRRSARFRQLRCGVMWENWLSGKSPGLRIRLRKESLAYDEHPPRVDPSVPCRRD